MKRFMPVFLFVASFAVSAQAQQLWGIRAGVVEGHPMVGGEMIIRLSNGFFFNPNVELSGDLLTLNADANYTVDANRFSAFWFGIGAALVHPQEQDLDVGVNLFAGLGKRTGSDVVYAQFKTTVSSSEDSYGSVSLGYRF